MIKRKFVTKSRIKEVAEFIKDSIDWLVEEDCGCCRYNLDGNFAIYVGWEEGFDVSDKNIIASPNGRTTVHNSYIGDWECGWAIVCAVKIRNDYDCSDFEYLNYPTGTKPPYDCWINGGSLAPCDNYELDAKDLLSTYVDLVNALNRNQIML